MDRSDLDRLLRILADVDGSDLHIKAGRSPRIRVDGMLRMLEDEPPFTADETLASANEMIPPRIRDVFEEKHEADFAYSVPGLGRFRTNAFFQRSSVALAMRRVRTNASTFSDLGLPDVVRRLSEHHRGLVLVTGPTGSGKTTTWRPWWITSTTCVPVTSSPSRTRWSTCTRTTWPDRPARGRVRHRELHLRHAHHPPPGPRRHPHREMRNLETVYTALTAAETGHLVFSTLHTTTATETINRIVDFFPPHQQGQVR